MKKTNIFLLFLFFLFSCSSWAVDVNATKQDKLSIFGDQKPKTVSEKKVQKIEELIYTYINRGNDIENEHIRTVIIDDVKKQFPLKEGTIPTPVDVSKIEKDLTPVIVKKFPFSDKELVDKYTSEAEDIYKPLPINSIATITYKQGPYKKTITGRYFGLTYYNDGIKIENSIIPIFDLSDVDKSKFDSKVREIKIKNYVDSKIESYNIAKKDFTERAIHSKIEEIMKQNEDYGFLFIWNKWYTPEEVANILLDYYIANKLTSSKTQKK